MAEVNQWDPKQFVLHAGHREILARASLALDKDDLGISASDQASLRPVMRLPAQAWEAFASKTDEDEILAWVKVITLAEERLSGFDVGSRSPVIALVRHLRARGELPEELLKWIRANTSNRFLPYGSLNDRL